MSNYQFTETPNTRGKIIDSITLTSSDYLSFPTFFVEKHKIKEIAEKLYIRLYYDSNKNAVAIQFTDIKTEGSYPVNGPKEYGATCKVKSFLLNNEISTEKYAGKYEYKKVSAHEIGLSGSGIFVIELGASPENPAEGQAM